MRASDGGILTNAYLGTTADSHHGPRLPAAFVLLAVAASEGLPSHRHDGLRGLVPAGSRWLGSFSRLGGGKLSKVAESGEEFKRVMGRPEKLDEWFMAG